MTKEIIANKNINPKALLTESLVLCDECRQGFYLQHPRFAPKERLNEYLKQQYTCPNHPVYETVEVMSWELGLALPELVNMRECKPSAKVLRFIEKNGYQ